MTELIIATMSFPPEHGAWNCTPPIPCIPEDRFLHHTTHSKASRDYAYVVMPRSVFDILDLSRAELALADIELLSAVEATARGVEFFRTQRSSYYPSPWGGVFPWERICLRIYQMDDALRSFIEEHAQDTWALIDDVAEFTARDGQAVFERDPHDRFEFVAVTDENGPVEITVTERERMIARLDDLILNNDAEIKKLEADMMVARRRLDYLHREQGQLFMERHGLVSFRMDEERWSPMFRWSDPWRPTSHFKWKKSS